MSDKNNNKISFKVNIAKKLWIVMHFEKNADFVNWGQGFGFRINKLLRFNGYLLIIHQLLLSILNLIEVVVMIELYCRSITIYFY